MFLNGLLIILFALLPATASAQEVGKPVVRTVASKASVTGLAPVSLLKVWQPGDPVQVLGDLKRRAEQGQLPAGALQAAQADPLLAGQSIAGSGAQPTVTADFDGIPATRFVPPDHAGAVGRNHYIQMVNVAIAIFDKKGNRLFGPSAINSIWKGFGGPCESENNGDPIARYDHMADRWLISQFAIEAHFQCIAISRGPNPVTDGWHLYAFPTVTPEGTPVTPDYPKLTVWPDAYYMGTQRGFPNDGLDVWAFEREKMLMGQPARQIQFSVGAPSLFLMPSDVDGPAPPAGTPNFFIRHVSGTLFGGQDRLEIFQFATNWAQPELSTFKLSQQIPVAKFSAVLCGDMFSGNCAPQPGTDVKLETLPAWMMWRAQYRTFSGYDTIVTNHTVNADGNNRAGVRWYELRREGAGAWTKYQEGTHAPDSNHRWMGSIAMDSSGNIALGYSVSGASVFPSIRVSSRRPNDPLGTLSGEFTLREGKGAQTSPSARWGDYTSMDIDPVEPCTFWYTNQYYPDTSEVGWRTRVSAFRMPACKASGSVE